MRYKAIGFDYGGVIAGIPSPEFDRQVIKLLNVSLETYHNVYFSNNHLINHDALSVAEFWGKVLNEMSRGDKLDEFLKFLKSLDQHKIDEHVLSLAKKLKTLGYKVGILSNNTSEKIEQMRKAGLMEIFDIVAVSTQIGFSKPEPEAFNIFIKQLNIKPTELIFIDDTEKSLEKSKEIGFYPIQYTGFAKLKSDLNEIGIVI